MGLTTAQINSDIDAIQTDLASLDVTENVTIGGTPYVCFRRRNLTGEQLTPYGWAADYKFSVMIQRSDGMSVAVDDVVTMATEGRMRVLALEPGPARALVILHLGDEFPGVER